jgi:hypothetical protein
MGIRGPFPGRKADHSPPPSAEVKNAWSYTSTPQYAFMAWCSIKAQGQLYLYVTYMILKLPKSVSVWKVCIFRKINEQQ